MYSTHQHTFLKTLCMTQDPAEARCEESDAVMEDSQANAMEQVISACCTAAEMLAIAFPTVSTLVLFLLCKHQQQPRAHKRTISKKKYEVEL